MELQADHTKNHLTLGGFIASIYEICGSGKARGIVRLAIDTRLIQFQRSQLFVDAQSLLPQHPHQFHACARSPRLHHLPRPLQ